MVAQRSFAAQNRKPFLPSRRWYGQRQNVGPTERLISLVGGGLIAAYGLSRGTTNGLLLGALGGALAYRGATGFCHAYQALGFSSAVQAPATAIPSGQGIRIEESILVHRSPAELFSFWRRLENLPRVMRHLISVNEIDSRRSHWVAKGLTENVEWDAEIITERPGELIGWRSLPDSTVSTAGSVHFNALPDSPATPGKHSTEVKINLNFNPPAGQVGAAIGWLAGLDPKREIREDLQRFKRFMEQHELSPPGTAPSRAGESA